MEFSTLKIVLVICKRVQSTAQRLRCTARVFDSKFICELAIAEGNQNL